MNLQRIFITLKSHIFSDFFAEINFIQKRIALFVCVGKAIMSCEQGDKVDGNVVVCYNKSFSIENQLNIDNLILSRWNAAMNNGFFRFVFFGGKINLKFWQ